jgi:hypothetical protein
MYEFNLIRDSIRVTNDNFSYNQHKDFVRNKKKYVRQLMRSKVELLSLRRRGWRGLVYLLESHLL